MEEFALIMRHQDGKALASPEQMQIWMQQTMDWIGGIAAQNKFVSGTGLPFEDARVVSSSHVVTNGPYGEIKETIGGFITVTLVIESIMLLPLVLLGGAAGSRLFHRLPANVFFTAVQVLLLAGALGLVWQGLA